MSFIFRISSEMQPCFLNMITYAKIDTVLVYICAINDINIGMNANVDKNSKYRMNMVTMKPKKTGFADPQTIHDIKRNQQNVEA